MQYNEKEDIGVMDAGLAGIIGTAIGALVGGIVGILGSMLMRRWQAQDLQNTARAAIFQGGLGTLT